MGLRRHVHGLEARVTRVVACDTGFQPVPGAMLLLLEPRITNPYSVSMPGLFSKTPGGWFRAHNATLTGDVTIGAQTSFWFNSVVRGDVARIVIGQRVNVQDCAVVHVDTGIDNIIEDDVTIGHGAIVHGQFVGRGTLIGMGATVLGRTKIGRECLIAAGAVVPPGLEVPDRMAVIGVPGKIVRPVKEEELKYMKWLNPHYVALAEKYVRGEFPAL
jgi:carbonic anhydrase/acetyltransferase-like protein (isoleucine patch superfamily)